MARPRTARPFPAWKNHDWQSDDWDRIRTHLVGKREQIARLLNMNPEARETQIAPVIADASTEKQQMNRYFAMRRAKGRPALVRSIDLVIDDMTHVLHDFVVSQVNGMFPMSKAKVRSVVEQIANQADITESELERLPLPVLKVLAAHYPLGREQFAPDLVDPASVISAANQFIEGTSAPERGRPPGVKNIFARILVFKLANIFENNAPRKPTRSSVFQTSIAKQIETGSFYQFVQCAAEALPDNVSPIRAKGSLARLVRDEIASRQR